MLIYFKSVIILTTLGIIIITAPVQATLDEYQWGTPVTNLIPTAQPKRSFWLPFQLVPSPPKIDASPPPQQQSYSTSTDTTTYSGRGDSSTADADQYSPNSQTEKLNSVYDYLLEQSRDLGIQRAFDLPQELPKDYSRTTTFSSYDDSVYPDYSVNGNVNGRFRGTSANRNERVAAYPPQETPRMIHNYGPFYRSGRDDYYNLKPEPSEYDVEISRPLRSDAGTFFNGRDNYYGIGPKQRKRYVDISSTRSNRNTSPGYGNLRNTNDYYHPTSNERPLCGPCSPSFGSSRDSYGRSTSSTSKFLPNEPIICGQCIPIVQANKNDWTHEKSTFSPNTSSQSNVIDSTAALKKYSQQRIRTSNDDWEAVKNMLPVMGKELPKVIDSRSLTSIFSRQSQATPNSVDSNTLRKMNRNTGVPIEILRSDASDWIPADENSLRNKKEAPKKEEDNYYYDMDHPEVVPGGNLSKIVVNVIRNDVLTKTNKYRTFFDLNPLRLNENLNNYSQDRANTMAILMSPDCKPPTTSKYGETVFCGIPCQHIGELIVDLWAYEVGQLKAVETETTLRNNKAAKQLFQLAWKQTMELGVGAAKDLNGYIYVVTNFHPPISRTLLYIENLPRFKKEHILWGKIKRQAIDNENGLQTVKHPKDNDNKLSRVPGWDTEINKLKPRPFVDIGL